VLHASSGSRSLAGHLLPALSRTAHRRAPGPVPVGPGHPVASDTAPPEAEGRPATLHHAKGQWKPPITMDGMKLFNVAPGAAHWRLGSARFIAQGSLPGRAGELQLPFGFTDVALVL